MPAINPTSERAAPSFNPLRNYAPHEAGYWTAQSYGFEMISRVENAIRDRDSWAGRYTGQLNPDTEEYDDISDCSGEYDAADLYARDLAADAALGNARMIVVAQGRTDEAAQMILAVPIEPG
ncbi:hypothetical protein [Sphingomonas trueperi]|uniref:hypothetical protein n=1 Tax=Sphingomonas trueperi TaxID=53317 RepID=UPI000F19608F